MALIGARLRARGFDAQQTEAAIGATMLNLMLAAGWRQPVIAQQLGVWGKSRFLCRSAPTSACAKAWNRLIEDPDRIRSDRHGRLVIGQ